MMLFHRGTHRNYTVIAGCGRLGAHLADTLSGRGENVLVIDSNQNAFRRLSSSFGGLVLTGDATDLDILHEARISDAVAVLAVTGSDNVNIMISQLARERFGVKKVIARLYDPDCARICREFGIAAVCPAAFSAGQIVDILFELSESALEPHGEGIA